MDRSCCEDEWRTATEVHHEAVYQGSGCEVEGRGRPAVGYLDLLKADLNLPDLNPSGL